MHTIRGWRVGRTDGPATDAGGTSPHGSSTNRSSARRSSGRRARSRASRERRCWSAPTARFVGTVGGAALEERVKELAQRALHDRAGDLHHFDLQAWKPGGLPSLCGGAVDIAIEYVPARPNLLLWGGGHVAHALASILPTLEYDYSVADDRPEWVGSIGSRAPSAEKWSRPTSSGTSFDAVHVHASLPARLRREEGPRGALSTAVTQFPNRIGLIASAAKREHMYATLRERGVSREAIARIRSPGRDRDRRPEPRRDRGEHRRRDRPRHASPSAPGAARGRPRVPPGGRCRLPNPLGSA